MSQSGFYFDTVITITLYGRQEESILQGAFSECEAYEALLSPTIQGSDVWNINHSKGSAVTVSDDTLLLIKKALSYCEASNGAIDITTRPLSELWDFSSETPHVPAESDIQALLKNVDYHTVTLEGNTVTLKNPKAEIDLGFLAKGFIADRLKVYLTENGVKSALINLGGNVLAVGEKPGHTPFQIGIQKPFDTRNTAITTVSCLDSSVVSSGVYERYFTENGKRYHHILNPKTGFPVENHLLGVTILSDSSMEGDGLSTTCFVLGLKKGMDYIESIPHAEALFITEDYELHYSSGFSQP